MKSLKALTMGVMTSATLVSTAMAVNTNTITPVYAVGSTAFRAPLTAAIVDYLSAGGTKTVYAAAFGTSLLGGSGAIVANGTLGTNGTATQIVETFFTGSLAGVVDVAVGQSVAGFPASTNTTVQTAVNASPVSSTFQISSTTGNITGDATVSAVPDLAMSDSFKGTIQSELSQATLKAPITGTHGTFSTVAAISAAAGGANIVDSGTSNGSNDALDVNFVGIVPFEWVAGLNSPLTPATATSNQRNITQQIARELITNGYVPQQQFTGGTSDADLSNYFYLVGRNEDSGTRIGAFQESQFGVTATPQQYQVNGGTAVQLYPPTALNTEPNISFTGAGHSGYVSGGNVASNITAAGGALTFTNGQAPNNTGNSYFIGYLGITDAAGIINPTTSGGVTTPAKASALSYGGVPFSIAAVNDGSYTFWTYEHAYHFNGEANTAVVNAIAEIIYNSDADISATDGSHGEQTGGSTSAGLLANPNAPIFYTRSLTEGGVLSPLTF